MLRQFFNFIKVKSQGLSTGKTWVYPGHFYSPITDAQQLKSRENAWNKMTDDIKGVNLRNEEQLRLLDELLKYYKELPFGDNKKPDLRYYYRNEFYSYSDAIFLYSMIRYLKPGRIIEVGSGYSSCVTLDTNELFFENKIYCTFIEPYPDIFLSLIKERDKTNIKLIQSGVQDVGLDIFKELQPNDILFIDSTHVSKTGSDVNYIFFEILPALNTGVYIHFHDIFYPFEYPKDWIYEGRSWNEDYILRAFLQYNNTFQIMLFNTFLFHFYRDIINQKMPLCQKNPGGSIWIKKC